MTKTRPDLNLTSDPTPMAILTLASQPDTPTRRAQLKQQLKDGTLTELEFEASVFRLGPNRNHVRFRDEDIPAFAASFAGVPFLRNHDVHDIAARDGTVVDSRLVGSEFHQTIRLTTERGIRDFLDQIIDRFSIAWYHDDIHCSICQSSWLACPHWPGRLYPSRTNPAVNETCELIFIHPQGKETSAVNTPAVPGTHILDTLCQCKEQHLAMSKKMIYLPNGEAHVVDAEVATTYGQGDTDAHDPLADRNEAVGSEQSAVDPDSAPTAYLPTAHSPTEAMLAEMRQIQAQIEQHYIDQAIAHSGLSAAGREVVRQASQGRDRHFAAQLIEAQRQVEAQQADRALVRGIRPVIAAHMTTPHDRVQAALNWIFGVREENMPPPSMRSIRDLYQAITGDHNWYGVFNPDWSQLDSANTTTLAGMVVNALNKVVRTHYDNMATYRWYESIVAVDPHDGTTHDVQLIMVDGMANLPTVAEGAAYTEAIVGDSKETLSFTKRGHYVGITLEAIRKSDIQRIQAIPREMVKGAIRARSAAIASIFTTNNGAGPTLADDETALFHNNHGNLGTAALADSAWAAARASIWEQTVPGTSKPLGLWPTFCLVPIELYDTALTLFGYGTGDVGKPNGSTANQTVNPYGESRPGDPRPIPIPVPDWTDADDWAYLVDPRLHPVIHMAYANAPQGGQHPLPEIFEVTSETSGLMFTNDTLPVKVRDWWGYGVSTYVGIGKNNVSAD